MAAGDAETGGLPRVSIGAIISTSNHLRSARQSLVCYAAIVCGMCGVRFSVGCCAAPVQLGRLRR